jgi:DNA-binding NarL/FixJ family response regulator
MIQLLIVDPDSRVRQGLRMRLALEPDLSLVGEAQDVPRAAALMDVICPDVVLIDVDLPGADGMAWVSELARCAKAPAILLLTMRDDRRTREQAVRSGAAGLVSKQQSVSALLSAIRCAARRSERLTLDEVRPPPTW